MYKTIEELVTRVDERNSNGTVSELIGVSIDKCFIKSVANTNGTDLSKYKIIRKNDFAVSLMQVSRDGKIPVARLEEYEEAIMSPAYPIFRVKDKNIILPEYLEMWFKRPEFDREAAFIAVGGVRGSMPWEEFAKMKLPVPPIEKQRKIVNAYKIVTDRIALKQKINEDFENKYADRKDRNGELKSTTLKQKKFEYGFASLDKGNTQFIMDFLSIFDESTKLYFSVESKIEYLILQLFIGYQNNLIIDADEVKYSITKALVVYRPQNVIKSIYDNPEGFVEELKRFFRERIECNSLNIKLKDKENKAFENILYILNDISAIPELQWDYHMPFSGFMKYLQEEQIKNYALVLDKEGEQNEVSRTMQAACEMGLSNVTEENSKDNYGLRMADMMAGIISKLLKSLCDALHYHSVEEGTQKKLLDKKWFQLNEVQLKLYKKLYKIICEWDNVWYKSYAGIYSDDLVCFIGLLGYMAHFENKEQIINEKLEMQGEYFNGYVCRQLSDYFNRRRSKLPIDLIDKNDEEYFLNRRGAKVYFDITKQPILQIAEGSQTEMVLSVGMDKSGAPLITISNEGEPICYRLPGELSDWALMAVGMANMGENLFPSQVVFTKEKNRYFADIL